jgi:putative photosynthetic complex assembly protein 2
MRTSAKLNLFLGVRNLSEAFLPPPLAYLQSFFRRRPMNALLPFSVLAAAGVLAAIVLQALHPATDSAQSIGLVLVGTLLALAIVEHLLLVLPVDTTALWHWALGQRRPSPVRTA